MKWFIGDAANYTKQIEWTLNESQRKLDQQFNDFNDILMLIYTKNSAKADWQQANVVYFYLK